MWWQRTPTTAPAYAHGSRRITSGRNVAQAACTAGTIESVVRRPKYSPSMRRAAWVCETRAARFQSSFERTGSGGSLSVKLTPTSCTALSMLGGTTTNSSSPRDRAALMKGTSGLK